MAKTVKKTSLKKAEETASSSSKHLKDPVLNVKIEETEESQPEPSSPTTAEAPQENLQLDELRPPLVVQRPAALHPVSKGGPLKTVKKTSLKKKANENASSSSTHMESPVLDMEIEEPEESQPEPSSPTTAEAPQENLRLDELRPPVVVQRPAALHPVSKRTYEFHCKFTQIVAFKSFFENLGSVLHEVVLEVHNDPNGFKGIVADSMDARGVALVHGKLAGQVELNVPCATFCIIVKDILDIFPCVHPPHFVDVYRIQGSTDITVYIYEPSIRTSTPSMRIKTLARSTEKMELNEMDYSYYVEIELASFRNALKVAKSKKASSIQLCVYEIPRAQGEEKTIFFVVKFTGENGSTVSFPYESRIVTTSSDQGPITIKAIEGGGDSCDEEDSMSMEEKLEDMTPSYQGNFLAEYLFLFVKSMDRFNLTLRLADERPLIVDYPLGCSATDGLRYVLAPQCSVE